MTGKIDLELAFFPERDGWHDFAAHHEDREPTCSARCPFCRGLAEEKKLRQAYRNGKLIVQVLP